MTLNSGKSLVGNVCILLDTQHHGLGCVALLQDDSEQKSLSTFPMLKSYIYTS